MKRLPRLRKLLDPFLRHETCTEPSAGIPQPPPASSDLPPETQLIAAAQHTLKRGYCDEPRFATAYESRSRDLTCFEHVTCHVTCRPLGDHVI
jgi:hypothetical protein